MLELFLTVVVVIVVLPICLIVGLASSGKKKRVDYGYNYDSLSGEQFENYCATILSKNGFNNVVVTKGSGDHGVDIIAYYGAQKYAIQCKRYSNNIGNKAVQEVYSGKAIYNAQVAVVMTNQFFTKQAINDANKLGVLLWNRNKLNEMIDTAQQMDLQQNLNSQNTAKIIQENKNPRIERFAENESILHFLYSDKSKKLFDTLCIAAEGEIKRCYDDSNRYDVKKEDLIYREFVTKINYFASTFCYAEDFNSLEFVYYSKMSKDGLNSSQIKELNKRFNKDYNYIAIYVYFDMKQIEFRDNKLNLMIPAEVSFEPETMETLKILYEDPRYVVNKDSVYFFESQIEI